MYHNFKCRGKIVNFDKWFYGYYNESSTAENGEKLDYPICFITDDDFEENKPLSNGTSFYIVNPDTVTMSTGLFDHSHKEVFGGDVLVQCKHVMKSNLGRKYVIFWSDKQSGFKIKALGDDDSKGAFISESKLKALKVVGNIFEGEYKL